MPVPCARWFVWGDATSNSPIGETVPEREVVRRVHSGERLAARGLALEMANNDIIKRPFFLHKLPDRTVYDGGNLFPTTDISINDVLFR
jgi:hypothetical protein